MLTGCARNNGYPPMVVGDYMASCTASGTEKLICDCTLQKLQQQYSVDKFIAVNSAYSVGTPEASAFTEDEERAATECKKTVPMPATDSANAEATPSEESASAAPIAATTDLQDAEGEDSTQTEEKDSAPIEPEAPKLEFPYKAVIRCGQAWMNADMCLIRSVIELKNGNDYGMFKHLDIVTGRGPGKQTRDGYVIELRQTFELALQNSSEHELLNVKVFDQASGAKLFEKSATQFDYIYVKN